MKICIHRHGDNRIDVQGRNRSIPRRAAGSALLIVLILLGIMGTLVVSNSVTLRRLKVELQLLEQKQNRAVQARPLAPEPPPH